MTKEAAEDLICVPKAARILGLSIPYTQRLIRSGRIKGQKIGRDWVTPKEALKVYLKTRKYEKVILRRGDGP